MTNFSGASHIAQRYFRFVISGLATLLLMSGALFQNWVRVVDADTNITTLTGCTWTAASNDSWITLTGGSSGSGGGTVSFNVQPTNGPPRTGTITAAGQTFTVNQRSGCAFTLSRTNFSFDPVASGSFFDITPSNSACGWTAVSNSPWINISSGSSGTGNVTVFFGALANTGPARTGNITAVGQTVTINQANGCAFAFSPTGTTFSAVGGGGGFNVTTDPACIWTAISNAPWMTIDSGAGTGNGSVTFTVQPNSGGVRSGALTIDSQAFSVNQLAPSAFATVSGRVVSPSGTGLRNAVVSITDSLGVRRTATTSSFGFYSFDNVATGQNYTIAVSSRLYRFQPRIVSPLGDLTNIDFVGLE